MKGPVLITGTTGFVGMELLSRYLERSDREIYTLVRAADDAAARERIDGVLENLFGSRVAKRYAERVHPIAGELTESGLGLGAERSRELAREVSTIVYSAASVSFTLPLDRGARDQRRGHPADARVRRARAGARRARALRARLDRVRRRHARRQLC